MSNPIKNQNQPIENNNDSNLIFLPIKIGNKEESNVNMIYDKKINEKKINIPLTSQTNCATNDIIIERVNNNNILFHDDNESIDDLYFGISKTKFEFEDNSKKKKKDKIKYYRKRMHNDLQLDNIRSNLKNKFFNFIIEFFNGLIKTLIEKNTQCFRKINYRDKNKITKIELNRQFNMTMTEILSLDIQSNYTNYHRTHNRELLSQILNIIHDNYSYYISIFNMKLYEFYEKIFVNGNRLELEKEFNLPKNAYLLNETISQLRTKTDKYKELFKKTALNILQFSQIKNYIEDNNKEDNYSTIKGEKDIFETEIQMKDENESNSSKDYLTFDESYLRKRYREDI